MGGDKFMVLHLILGRNCWGGSSCRVHKLGKCPRTSNNFALKILAGHAESMLFQTHQSLAIFLRDLTFQPIIEVHTERGEKRYAIKT
eukprot:5638675-Amphidinium_carterae.1